MAARDHLPAQKRQADESPNNVHVATRRTLLRGPDRGRSVSTSFPPINICGLLGCVSGARRKKNSNYIPEPMPTQEKTTLIVDPAKAYRENLMDCGLFCLCKPQSDTCELLKVCEGPIHKSVLECTDYTVFHSTHRRTTVALGLSGSAMQLATFEFLTLPE